MSLAPEGPGGKLHCRGLGRPVGARTGGGASYGDSCGVGANLVRATLGMWMGLTQAAGFPGPSCTKAAVVTLGHGESWGHTARWPCSWNVTLLAVSPRGKLCRTTLAGWLKL